jgi:hypothetical protein
MNVIDRRQATASHPDGFYLAAPPGPLGPAVWTVLRDYALSVSREEFERLAQTWPYLRGCCTVAEAPGAKTHCRCYYCFTDMEVEPASAQRAQDSFAVFICDACNQRSSNRVLAGAAATGGVI